MLIFMIAGGTGRAVAAAFVGGGTAETLYPAFFRSYDIKKRRAENQNDYCN